MMEDEPLQTAFEASPKEPAAVDSVWVEFLVGCLRLADKLRALDSEDNREGAPEAE